MRFQFSSTKKNVSFNYQAYMELNIKRTIWIFLSPVHDVHFWVHEKLHIKRCNVYRTRTDMRANPYACKGKERKNKKNVQNKRNVSLWSARRSDWKQRRLLISLFQNFFFIFLNSVLFCPVVFFWWISKLSLQQNKKKSVWDAKKLAILVMNS